MLLELIQQGYGDEENLNCAEKILYGANQVYHLGLDKQALKLSAGFGGGMGVGNVCGVLTASVMVLGCLFVKDQAHESSKIKNLTQKLFENYQQEMGELNCYPLKARYRTEELKCLNVIAKAAEILDRIIKQEKESTPLG